MITRARILLINSDPATTDALKRLLRDESWACRYVTDGDQALAAMHRDIYELVVAATSTTGTEEAALLDRIRRQFPSTIRILLANNPRAAAVAEALASGCAQQIVPKPWIDQELKEVLRSALRQASYQQRYSLDFQRLINTLPLLPPLPETYTRVRQCISGDEIDIEKMAGAISQDVAMSALLLHWGNSALFGQRFLVDSIKKAIIVLGTDIVEHLILSESIQRAVGSSVANLRGFSLQQFKKHSIATAAMTRLLIKWTDGNNLALQDRAFISGLLHDMGKLLLAGHLPQQFQQALDLTDEKQSELIDAERLIYRTDHTEIGGLLAEWWSLPPFLAEVVRYHHQPHLATTETDLVAATSVANRLTAQFGLGTRPEKRSLPIEHVYRDRFHLNEEALELLESSTLAAIADLSG